MNKKKNNDLERRLAEIKLRFIKDFDRRFRKMTSSFKQLKKNWDKKILQAFLHETHKLSGTASTMGYTEIGNTSRSLEALLVQLDARKNIKNENYFREIENLLKCILEMSRLMKSANEDILSVGSIMTNSSVDLPSEVWIFVEKQKEAKFLAKQIFNNSLFVRIVQSVDHLKAFLKEESPGLLIIEYDYLKKIRGHQKLINELQSKQIPLFFISQNDDLQTRLKMVRLEGRAFFTKPIDVLRLLNKIESVVSFRAEAPFRVLVVDDDPIMTEYYASVLEQDNVITEAVNRPNQLLDIISSVNPDVILMDLYMGRINGQELSAVIEQHQNFFSIPVIYLSREQNLDRQVEALRAGGEVFLTKPVNPDHLKSIVVSKARRARYLNSFMQKDGLTGIWNRMYIMDRLENEVNRVVRNDSFFSLAMIDIDRFKSVNDTYGHSVGDRVLKTLASHFEARLRSVDSVGRYGGEEFLIIFPDTKVAVAKKVLEEVLLSFSEVEHFSNEKKRFLSTFSGGIAQFNKNKTVEDILDESDKLMYTAKENGRNQIVAENVK